MPKARGTVVSLSEDYFWENKNTAFENLWTENLEPTASFFTVSMILHIANPVFKIVFAYRVLLCSVITIHSNGRTIVTNDNKTWKKNLSLTPPPSSSLLLSLLLSLSSSLPHSHRSLFLSISHSSHPLLFSSSSPFLSLFLSFSHSPCLFISRRFSHFLSFLFPSPSPSPFFFPFSSHLHLPLPIPTYLPHCLPHSPLSLCASSRVKRTLASLLWQ